VHHNWRKLQHAHKHKQLNQASSSFYNKYFIFTSRLAKVAKCGRSARRSERARGDATSSAVSVFRKPTHWSSINHLSWSAASGEVAEEFLSPLASWLLAAVALSLSSSDGVVGFKPFFGGFGGCCRFIAFTSAQLGPLGFGGGFGGSYGSPTSFSYSSFAALSNTRAL